MKKAIYPGSFDPITNGHIDIIRRARCVFDHVTVAIFNNMQKNPLLSLEERVEIAQDLFKDDDGVTVQGVSGLLANFAKDSGVNTIIRGLRALSDFDFEFQMALTNRSIGEDLDTVFFMTDEKYSYLSSSIIKQISQLGGEVSNLVPPTVEKALLPHRIHQ